MGRRCPAAAPCHASAAPAASAAQSPAPGRAPWRRQGSCLRSVARPGGGTVSMARSYETIACNPARQGDDACSAHAGCPGCGPGGSCPPPAPGLTGDVPAAQHKVVGVHHGQQGGEGDVHLLALVVANPHLRGRGGPEGATRAQAEPLREVTWSTACSCWTDGSAARKPAPASPTAWSTAGSSASGAAHVAPGPPGPSPWRHA